MISILKINVWPSLSYHAIKTRSSSSSSSWPTWSSRLAIPGVTYRKWIFGRASLLDQSPADNDNDEDGADHDDHVHDEDGGEDGVDDLCMRPTGRQGITVPKAAGKWPFLVSTWGDSWSQHALSSTWHELHTAGYSSAPLCICFCHRVCIYFCLCKWPFVTMLNPIWIFVTLLWGQYGLYTSVMAFG